jgi:hypothetical protein
VWLDQIRICGISYATNRAECGRGEGSRRSVKRSKGPVYSFRSFNVCVADAERAGFVGNVRALRRVRSSDLHASATGSASAGVAHHRLRRRRREAERDHGAGSCEPASG